MKAYVVIIFSFLLAYAALIPQGVFAQETPVLTPTVTPVQEVVYDMAYPGLLPDSPLYLLKTARDQIVGFLIVEPTKKATFDLLQADKRFRAGTMLLEKDISKKELAIATLSKGQNYYDHAIAKTHEAKKQNIEIGDIAGKIILSGQKQDEILSDLIASHPDLEKSLTPVQQRLKNLQKSAKSLRPTSE